MVSHFAFIVQLVLTSACCCMAILRYVVLFASGNCKRSKGRHVLRTWCLQLAFLTVLPEANVQ